jgi:site-specific recombinase XerD
VNKFAFGAIFGAMGSVFKKKGSKVWTGKVRAWSAMEGKWVWEQVPTGQTDKAKAMGIVAHLEAASSAAKAGKMTRAKALALVNDILKLAGAESIRQIPSLREIYVNILRDRSLSEGSQRKYDSVWKLFAEWAGERATEKSADAWTADDMVNYYRDLRSRVGVSTANGHLNIVSMLFVRAIALGYRDSNPTEAVERATGQSDEKGIITRSEQSRLLRCQRKAGAKLWVLFCSLSWHTGHRIQDLLDVTRDSINGDLVTIQPRKKRGQQNARIVVLPLPLWLAKAIKRARDFKRINGANNRSGKVSGDFIKWLAKAGVENRTLPGKKRDNHLKSHHSYRHSLSTRLLSAGVPGKLAQLITDHDSEEMHKRYQHAEIEAIRQALRKAR